MTRAVSWGDLHNARDLGGLPTPHGATRFGAVFRAPRLDTLTADGWEQLRASGVRTIVDLRNDGEGSSHNLRPASMTLVRRPIEDQGDESFMAEWGARLGSPAYYPEALRRWPGLIAAVVSSVADADGGVVIHCSAGRDRTGLVTAILLEIAGVERGAILDDYELGVRSTNDWLREHSIPSESPRSDDELDAIVLAAREQLLNLLRGVDINAYLIGAGVEQTQLDRIRSKLIGH